MHFPADRAAMRPRCAVAGQQTRPGLDFVQVFADGERVPDLDSAVRQARYEDRRRQQQELLARVGVVGRDHDLLEGQSGESRKQPPAQ